MKKILTLLALTALLLSSAACQDDGESTSTQQFRNGDYVATYLYFYPIIRDGGWDYDYLEFIDVELTIHNDGVSGTATVSDEEGSYEPGDTNLDWTVGDEVAITGSIEGSVISLRVRAEDGTQLQAVLGLYDGTVTERTEDYEFMTVSYMQGICETSATGYYPASECYIDDLEWVGSASSQPSPVELLVGSGDSVYRDGGWSGTTTSYVTREQELDLDEYQEVDFSYDLTFSGNTLTGTANLDDPGDGDTWNGFPMDTQFAVSGTIRSTVVDMTLTNGDFSHRIQLAPDPDDSEDTGVIGQVGTLPADYGVADDTDEFYSGDVASDLYHDDLD